MGLEDKLAWANVLDNTYWVCAFSVDQHSSICGQNPHASTDAVTNETHNTCTCGKRKFFNDSHPLRSDGKAIECEMNKFDSMLTYLLATDEKFAQVISVDQDFTLFSRAWCVAEIAFGFEYGAKQHMKIFSERCLADHEVTLRELQIEDMKASRAEDIEEILSTIGDTRAFNVRLQDLIFGSMIADWRSLDVNAKMKKVGHFLGRDVMSEL